VRKQCIALIAPVTAGGLAVTFKTAAESRKARLVVPWAWRLRAGHGHRPGTVLGQTDTGPKAPAVPGRAGVASRRVPVLSKDAPPAHPAAAIQDPPESYRPNRTDPIVARDVLGNCAQDAAQIAWGLEDPLRSRRRSASGTATQERAATQALLFAPRLPRGRAGEHRLAGCARTKTVATPAGRRLRKDLGIAPAANGPIPYPGDGGLACRATQIPLGLCASAYDRIGGSRGAARRAGDAVIAVHEHDRRVIAPGCGTGADAGTPSSRYSALTRVEWDRPPTSSISATPRTTRRRPRSCSNVAPAPTTPAAGSPLPCPQSPSGTGAFPMMPVVSACPPPRSTSSAPSPGANGRWGRGVRQDGRAPGWPMPGTLRATPAGRHGTGQGGPPPGRGLEGRTHGPALHPQARALVGGWRSFSAGSRARRQESGRLFK
jgi:hypothetical protein